MCRPLHGRKERISLCGKLRDGELTEAMRRDGDGKSGMLLDGFMKQQPAGRLSVEETGGCDPHTPLEEGRSMAPPPA